jgi:hypothetical protein
LLKGKLTGEWVVAGQNDSYIYAFADDDTIYTKTREGDVMDKWPYQAIAGDSIRIVRSAQNWTTHNKVVFYSGDSIRINDFFPSVAAVYPPMFGDAVLIRFTETPLTEENPVLTVSDFNIPAGCSLNYEKMQHNSVYVINSEEEWAKIFTCESNPQIDFSTKTLLVAWGVAPSGIGDVAKTLLFANNTYTLTVDILLGVTAKPESWHIVLITDKITTQSVILNVNKYIGNEIL